MKKLNVSLLLLLSLHAPAFAQYADQPKNQWQQYFEQIADYDDIEDNNMEDMYERLCELETSPINLNTATADDLKQLSFLNSTQIEELTEYLDRYRPLQSMGELSMLQTLDPVRLNMLQCFVFIGNEKKDKQFPDIKDILKYGKHELVATASIPFYERKGDRSGYLGYQYKHWMRYTFKFGRYVQAERPTISGLVFLQGTTNQLRSFLSLNFPKYYLVNNCSTGKAASIPDSLMRPFMKIMSEEPERITFLRDPFIKFAKDHVKLRVLTGIFKGREGYVVRVLRDRQLVMDFCGYAVAISNVHREDFEIAE